MSDLDRALEQIRFARRYTRRLLDATPENEWFRQPSAGVSHITWQVGHLAMAQYRLALERIRGRHAEDEALISETFLVAFGRDSTPHSDPACYSSLDDIRAVFDRVHERLLSELPGLDAAELAAPPAKSHSLCATKLDVLMWCGQHEMLHAGQIGLLRRQLGHPPLW